MCEFCENYNFDSVGFRRDRRGYFMIFYTPVTGDIPENQRFQFCPVCGEPLTEKHFKDSNEINVCRC